ncbi:MAG: cyclopropane-fatty-acyl-phospholipid synthase family protein [Gammaproteobacteria bacterium]|nr:cyclopropane-fatty-acyl-phospholipid synthase family protein [Gammaproteobacteria bacterium]
MSTKEIAATGFGLRWNVPLVDAGLRLGGRIVGLSLRRLLQRIRMGTLTVEFPDGSRQTFRGDLAAGPEASLRINDYAALTRLFLKGDTGFAESYMDGHWDTPDLVGFMTLVKHNEDHWSRQLEGSVLSRAVNRMFHRRRDNHRRGSRRNIEYHYDLGNAFYAAWLDPTMTYSAALFGAGSGEPGQGDLETAQRRKYRRIGELAGIHGAADVLEVGCGWGGFLEHAVATTGCRATGITLSREQLAYAGERLARGGLAERGRVRLEDYRDVAGSYDAVVSIEMLEAVGEAHWPDYFRTLHGRLKPGAPAVVQVITIDDKVFESYRRRPDFIQRYIFPGGMLPSPGRLRREARRAGLVLDHVETFGADYATTLRLWRERFHAAWPRLRELGYGERFRRLWEYYLCYCETGFRDGVIDVGIYRFRRPLQG